MLTDIDGEYVVAIGSERGEWLLRKYVLAREARGEDLAKRDEVRRKALEKYQLSLDVPLEELPSLLERNYDSPLWAELGEKCLSCGSCTLVCPTCVCFDVHDEMELSLTQGVRYREWDSCLLQDFAKVATGENFRGERPNRLRHRLFRKGKYIIERFGKQGCVGCGRCIDACLAEVANPVNAYNRLKEVS
jgi:ferredoxin